MIGRIQGILLEKQVPHVLINVNGVGYEIETSLTTFFRLPEANQPISLHTHFVVREDAQLLYGFLAEEERLLFRTLIKVNGVGPKLALTILSSVDPDSFVHYIKDGVTSNLVKIPGVGKKTAERLVIEMRDRLAEWQVGTHPELTPAISTTKSTQELNQFQREAIGALVTLGYKPQEASRAISRISSEYSSSEELIRLALKGIANT